MGAMTEYSEEYYLRQLASLRTGDPAHQKRIKLVLDWLKPGPDNVILETGSGFGMCTREFARAGSSVVALDYMPMAHRIAARFLQEENVDLRKILMLQGDLYNLCFRDNSFDIINFSEVIEHLETPDQALAELHRVLRPGGRLFLSTWPNLANMVWRYRYAHGSGTKEDFNPHTPTRVKAALKRANFRILKFRLTNFYFTLPKLPREINAINQANFVVRILERSLRLPLWGDLMGSSIYALAEKS